MSTTKKRTRASRRVAPTCSAEDLYVALRESVKLQSHYAGLLNGYDGGKRRPFSTPEAWIARLRETGDLPNAPVRRGTPSPQVAGSDRGCHNCEHGHLGGWKTYRHWPCLTCRVGSGLCCGDDNWTPNAPRSRSSTEAAGSQED